MSRGPVPRRRHIELAGIGLGVGDEFGDRLGRNRWIYQHHERHADDCADRRDVADEIETELVVQCRVDGVRRTVEEERVTVRRRSLGHLGGDIAAGARTVLDHE
jgi:hypothetical protein